MKAIFFLLLLSLLNCFTVYTKDETVLEKEKLRTEDLKEERDVYVLTHSLNSKGLYLFLDAYRVEEKSKVDLIREKYKENKDFKYEDRYNLGKGGGCGSGDGCAVLAIIAMTYIALEFSTIPIRLMSLPQDRIREEIQKGNVNKIAPITTNHISFTPLNKDSKKKYRFQEDRIFIPIAELELDSFNSKKFPYQLQDSKTNNLILESNFDFSESISKYKELEPIIEENNFKTKLAECRLIYPNLTSPEVTYDKAKVELENICSNYAAREVNDFNKSQSRHTYCYNNFEGCYYLTRDLKNLKK